MEKKNKKEEKESEKMLNQNRKNDSNEALFIQRLIAYLLDVFIISIVASLVATPFVNIEKSDKLSEKSIELTEKYGNQKIDIKTYSIEYIDLSYKLARNNGMLSLVTIIFEILYFVVFQIYNNGQTIGKKLMKIRIISQNNSNLSMNQMIFRALVANSILVEIVSFAFMTFSSKYVYFYSIGIFEIVQIVVTIISIFMIMYGKNGCAVHDKLAHTKVIKV